MRVSGILLLGFLLTNCTRSMDTAERVSLDLSSFTKGGLSAQSTDAELEINFIAVNVTVDGVLHASCKLDPEFSPFWTGGCLANPAFPGQPEKGVEFQNVPLGNALVQVLLVAEESEDDDGGDGGDGELFKYAQGEKVLSDGDNPMLLEVKVAESTSDREGNAAGRYGTSFTGRMALQYKPEKGEPMTVFFLDMFAGWFNLYLLDGVPLQYTMVDEAGNPIDTLFGGPVGMDSPQFNSASAAVMTYESPEAYFGGGDSDDPEFQVLGFWDSSGNPASGVTVCYDSTTAFSDYATTDNAGNNTLTWPNDFTINAPAGSCGMSLPLVDAGQMNISGDLVLHSEGGDSPLFRGPFRLFQTPAMEPDFLYAEASGTQVDLNWEYLPGVLGADGLKGISVFYSTTYRGDLSREFEGAEGLNCYEFEKPASENGRFIDPDTGLSHFTRVDFANNTENVSFDAGVEMANKGLVVVCPRRAAPGAASGRAQYYSSAVGAGVRPAPAVSLEITGTNELVYPYLNDDSCTAFEVHSKDVNGNLGALPVQEGEHYTVTLSSANGNFYEDPFCTTGTSTLAMNYSGAKVWYRINLTPPQTVNPSVATHPMETVTLTPDTWSGLSTTVTSPAAYGFYIDTADEIANSLECVPVMVGHVDINGVPLNAGAVTVNLNSSEGYDIHAYWDDYCMSGPDNVAPMESGKSYAFFFVAPNTGGAEVTDTMTTTHDRILGQITDASFDIDYVRPPDANYMRVETSESFDSGANYCYAVYLTTYIPGDGGQSPNVYPGENLLYDLSATGPGNMTFFDNSSDCSGNANAITQITQTTGDLEVEVYLRVDSSGSYQLEVDELNVGGEFNFDMNITVTDP